MHNLYAENIIWYWKTLKEAQINGNNTIIKISLLNWLRLSGIPIKFPMYISLELYKVILKCIRMSKTSVGVSLWQLLNNNKINKHNPPMSFNSRKNTWIVVYSNRGLLWKSKREWQGHMHNVSESQKKKIYFETKEKLVEDK